MLLLDRRIGECIRIGDDIRIKVLTGPGGCIRIGVDAPQEIPVHREEVYQRLQKIKARLHANDDSFAAPPLDTAIAHEPSASRRPS